MLLSFVQDLCVKIAKACLLSFGLSAMSRKDMLNNDAPFLFPLNYVQFFLCYLICFPFLCSVIFGFVNAAILFEALLGPLLSVTFI